MPLVPIPLATPFCVLLTNMCQITNVCPAPLELITPLVMMPLVPIPLAMPFCVLLTNMCQITNVCPAPLELITPLVMMPLVPIPLAMPFCVLLTNMCQITNVCPAPLELITPLVMIPLVPIPLAMPFCVLITNMCQITNACPAPPGTENDVGDDSSGADTTCAAAECSAWDLGNYSSTNSTGSAYAATGMAFGATGDSITTTCGDGFYSLYGPNFIMTCDATAVGSSEWNPSTFCGWGLQLDLSFEEQITDSLRNTLVSAVELIDITGEYDVVYADDGAQVWSALFIFMDSDDRDNAEASMLGVSFDVEGFESTVALYDPNPISTDTDISGVGRVSASLSLLLLCMMIIL